MEKRTKFYSTTELSRSESEGEEENEVFFAYRALSL